MPKDDKDDLRELLRAAVAEVNEKTRAAAADGLARGQKPDDPAFARASRLEVIVQQLEVAGRDQARSLKALESLAERRRAELAQHPEAPRGPDGVPVDPELALKHRDLQRAERIRPLLAQVVATQERYLIDLRAIVQGRAEHDEAQRKLLEALLKGAQVLGVDTSDLFDG